MPSPDPTLNSNGTTICWGDNSHGQLGAGSTAPLSTIRLPVSGLGKVTVIDAGSDHICALPVGSGQPRCWGRGDQGRLGNGSTTDSNVPCSSAG